MMTIPDKRTTCKFAIALSAMLTLSAFGAEVFAAATPDGMTLYKQGKYAQAARAFDATIRANQAAPNSGSLYYYLGCCYYQLGQRAQAKSVFQYIRNTWPTSQEAQTAGTMLQRINTPAPSPAAPAPGSTNNNPPAKASATPATTEPTDEDKEYAAEVLAKALGHSERGHRTSADDLAKLPDNGKFNFRRGDQGHMEVTIFVNGKPVRCWFDTGAGAFFGMDQLREAGVDISKATEAGYTHGWAGKPVKIWSLPADVRLGNITRRIDLKMQKEPDALPLIGQDFVDGYQYEIDDKAGEVTMRKTYSGGPQIAMSTLYDVPCQLKRGDDVFDLTVNGKKCEAFIDTGASFSVLNSATAKSLGIEPPEDAQRVTMHGVGGSFQCIVGYYDLRVGPIHKPDFKMMVGGNIGNCIGQDFMSGWRFKVDRQQNLLRFFH